MTKVHNAALGALADRNRQEIVRTLSRDGDGTASGLAVRLGISRQAVAKHFAILRKAGIVRSERRGRETIYRLDPDPLAEAGAWLALIGAEWDRRLDNLRELFADKKAVRPAGETIDYSTLMRASPERAYDAFATAPGLDAWFTTGAEVDPRPGGRILMRWRKWGVGKVDLESGGPVLEADRPRRFVFRWNPFEEALDQMTTVELNFRPDPRGVIVRVKDGLFPDTPEGRRAFAQCAAGWGEALTLAKFHLEHGVRY